MLSVITITDQHDIVFNPHQRCGYSDSPFARRDAFLYCMVWKWVDGLGGKDAGYPFSKQNNPSSQALGPGPGPAKKDDKSKNC